VTLADPERLDVRGEVVGRDVFIDVASCCRARSRRRPRAHRALRLITDSHAPVPHARASVHRHEQHRGRRRLRDRTVRAPAPRAVLSGHVKVAFVEARTTIAPHSKVIT